MRFGVSAGCGEAPGCCLVGGGFPDLVVSVELGSIPSQGAGARMACACPITDQLRKRQDNDVRD